MGDLDRVDFGSVTQENLDATGGGGGWTVKDDGWYRMVIDTGVVKPNRNNTGHVAHVKLAFCDPEYSAQYEMTFFNVAHTKEKVQEIGIAQLKSLAIAAGHPEPDALSDLSEIIDKVVMVRLWSLHEGGKYSDVNGMVQQVGEFKSVSDYMDGDTADPGVPPEAPGGEPPPPGDGDRVHPDDVPF